MSMLSRTIIICLLLLTPSRAANERKVPPGCTPAPGATLSHAGYMDRVIHEKTGIELVLLPAGVFDMGAAGPGSFSTCAPVHQVTIAQPFYIGKTEVTNGQYKKFIAAANPKPRDDEPHAKHLRGKSIMPAGGDFPMVYVSWNDAKAYCDWAEDLDLPTEAEWEYACRSGTNTAFSFGGELDQLDNHAWTITNANGLPHRVGELRANPWGLHDMHGNVWEWTLDDFVYRYDGAPTDGSARIDGRLTKVLRGGSWSNSAVTHTIGSAARFNSAPENASNDVGFRVVLRLPQATVADDRDEHRP